MKTLKIFLLLMLTGSFLQLASQVNPVCIDLRNNGVKLDAKFFLAGNGSSAPTLLLLHGYPGNANSPYGLAERLCGCSLGGAIALSAAVHNPEIRKIIAVAGGSDISIYLQKMNRDPAFRVTMEKRIAAPTLNDGPIRGDSAYIHNYFEQILSNHEYFDLIKNAEKLKDREILFITGWLDTTVPIEEFIIPAYRHLKTLNPEAVSIKALETNHNFTNARDELTNSIIEWVKNK